MARLASRVTHSLLLASLHTLTALAAPPSIRPESGSPIENKSPLLLETLRKQSLVCRARGQEGHSDGSLSPRVLNEAPADFRVLGASGVVVAGCEMIDLVWFVGEEAEQASYTIRKVPLHRETEFRMEMVEKCWTINTEPSDMCQTFNDQSFQHLFANLFTARGGEFLAYPNGWNICVEFDNNRVPRDMPMGEATDANYKIVVNMKYGLLIMQASEQPRRILRERHRRDHWSTAQLDEATADPSRISDVVGNLWHHIHGSWGQKKFPVVHTFIPRFGAWEQKLEFVVLPQVQDPEDINSIVLTCLGLLFPGTQSIPMWPGVTFKAGDACYTYFIGMAPSKHVAEFLFEHRANLGHKVLESVTILSLEHPSVQQWPTLIWKVGDYTQQADADRIALFNDPNPPVVHRPPPNPGRAIQT